ncbi:unnamed protein product, partial [Symbiodinium sp. CCMP2592]
VRTLVRDKWVASYLAEHGRGGQDARAAAKREFTSAANKRQMLSSMLESGQVPPRLHAAATRLIMAWTSETPLRGPHEVEEDVMSSYRGSGTMFRYSGSWSRVDDAAMSAVLVAKGHNGISEVCSRLKCHPYVQGLWDECSAFRQQLVSSTPITRWTAAMELHVEASLAANPPIPSVHIHFMFDAIGKTISFRNEPGLKFRNSQPYRSLAAPVARGRACKRAYDQGHFYLTPLKTGAILHATNAPPFKSYAVSPEWITSMWQGDKLSPESAKELYLKCKKHVKQYCDNVTSQVQMTQQSNLQERQAAAQAALLRMHRPRVYLEPVEQEFLPQFQVDAFRRRFLVLDGPTKLGKTTSSLAGPEHTLELNCASSMEPNLRDFNNDVHRAIVFDEASCAMVLRHKKLFQGGVQPLELASSNTNCWKAGGLRGGRLELERWKVEAGYAIDCLCCIMQFSTDTSCMSSKKDFFVVTDEKMEEADAEDKKRYVEELYLKTSLEDIASLQDPSGSRQGIYKTAQRWIARRRTRNFVCNMNAIGVAPSSEQVAEEYRKQSASSVPTTDARGLRAWSSRFRRSFAFRLGKMKAAKPVEDVCAKAVLFLRHAAWLERSSAKQPVYINIDETALAYSFHAVACLRRKISSLSRTRRAEKQREANMGLNPRQVFVLLAIYVLTGDPAVALEYISAKAARERMEEADAEDKKRYVEELYLKTSLEDIASLQDPSGSRQGIYKTAQRWIARRRTKPVEDVCAKAVLFWRHAAWLERSSAKQPVYINIDETALAYSFHAAPGLIQRKFHAEVQIRPQDARGCITHVALDSSWNSARHMVSLLTLLGQLFRIRVPQYQAIVVFDAASCHLSPGVIREGRLQGLFMLPVPPGMTSYLQPLDLWCFGPYKKWLERENRQQRICQNGLAFAQAGLPTSEQRLHGKLASLFPEGIPCLEQALSPDEFAQLLPKRHDLTRTFSDWVGGPRREVPVLS